MLYRLTIFLARSIPGHLNNINKKRWGLFSPFHELNARDHGMKDPRSATSTQPAAAQLYSSETDRTIEPVGEPSDVQPIYKISHSKLASPTLKAFARRISGLAPKSRAIYLKAAKRAVTHCLSVADNSTDTAVLRLLEEMSVQEKRERFGRVHRFERFLRTRVRPVDVQMNMTNNLRLLERMQYKPVTAMTAVRDFALLAAWATIGEGRGVLDLSVRDVTGGDSELSIRGKTVPLAYRSMLRRWLKIRLRASRPEQYRILRRSSHWAASPLLFPRSNGQQLSRSAIYNALRRLQATAASPSDEAEADPSSG
jgi:hypothetical protein